MTWFDQFRKPNNTKPKRNAHRSPPIPVNGMSDIPLDATPEQCFSLSVTVERICERTTKNGDPCFFLHCRDADTLMFSVICWDWQWTKLHGQVEEGKMVTLKIKVPRDEFTAFTLV
jgi:DNA polymerase III alpha subunit